MAGDGRVAARRGGCERPEGIVAGRRVGYMCAARPTECRNVPQVVGVSKVERAGRRAHFRLHGHNPAAEAVDSLNPHDNSIFTGLVEASLRYHQRLLASHLSAQLVRLSKQQLPDLV